MKAKRFASRLLTAGSLGAALLLSAGYWATPADAHPRRHRAVRVERVRRVVRHDCPVVVYHHPRYYRPRPVVVEVRRPWYVETRRVYVDDEPFYFNAGLGLYLGGTFLDFEFSNYAPDGYVYYDPYCGDSFASVELYRNHLRRHRHESVLNVVRANVRLN